jgi:hypothetical protein
VASREAASATIRFAELSYGHEVSTLITIV